MKTDKKTILQNLWNAEAQRLFYDFDITKNEAKEREFINDSIAQLEYWRLKDQLQSRRS